MLLKNKTAVVCLETAKDMHTYNLDDDALNDVTGYISVPFDPGITEVDKN